MNNNGTLTNNNSTLTNNNSPQIYYYDPNHWYPIPLDKSQNKIKQVDIKKPQTIQNPKIHSPVPKRIERPAFKLS